MNQGVSNTLILILLYLKLLQRPEPNRYLKVRPQLSGRPRVTPRAERKGARVFSG